MSYEGTVNVEFKMQTDLATAVTVTTLGSIPDNTPASIMASVNSANSTTLDATNCVITSITEVGATISGTEDGLYKGTVNVTFTTKIALPSIITVTDLGFLPDQSAQTILNRLNALNGINLTLSDVSVTSITATGAVIAAL